VIEPQARSREGWFRSRILTRFAWEPPPAPTAFHQTRLWIRSQLPRPRPRLQLLISSTVEVSFSSMAIPAGTILGSYEILQQIGAGGMGEVYKANDRRLGRQVALKVLPAQFSGQEDFRQRFEREAQVIAGLNHPHICTLYDVGKQDGMEFLVMELLEGETMAARLDRGAIPLEDALRIAIQIADALDKAHTLGVTHRDLKPSNIMLTKSGAKLMDFGLAKRRTPVEMSGATLPTAAADLTQHGSIIGTVQYMAPEQVEGEEADARTDIFALGIVLFEMVTGKKAFVGKSQASLMASILHHSPAPMSTLQPVTPPSLQRVVEICMAKEPGERWQSAHDVMLQLKWITEGGSLAGVPAPVAHRRKTRERSAWILTAVSAVAAIALAALHFGSSPPEARIVRFSIAPNAGTLFGPQTAPIRPFPAISPDGKRIVFQAQESNEPVMLWVRSLDATEAHALAGTENAILPFWSPDSQNIGFSADGKIKRVPASGGPVQEVWEGLQQAEGTWGKDGTILYGNAGGGLYRVNAAGGKPVQVTTPNKELKESLHRAPYFLPDGRHFLYLAQSPNTIYVGSLDPAEPPKRLLSSDSRAVYASQGYLLFIRQGILMGQRFDADTLKLSGEAFNVAENVVNAVGNGRAAFAVSNDGTLVYRVGAAFGNTGRRVVWVDRSGKVEDSINQSGDTTAPRLSPDGKRLVVERRPMQGCVSCSDLWIIDLARGTNIPFTDGPGDEQNGIWSPDGNSIAYRANPDEVFALYRKATTGVGKEELLLKLDRDIAFVGDWSDDGKYILFTANDPINGNDIWYLPLSGDGKPQLLLQTKFNEGNARFSHDGRWVAYQSNRSGTQQVYVIPFPSASQVVPISVDGGTNPRWRQDGKELLFTKQDDRSLMAVDIKVTGTTLEPGTPKRLFQHPVGNAAFVTTPNADRFLFAVVPGTLDESASGGDTPLTVVLHWTAGLKQ
jgi:serine/threonine protein kinase/Tol biopolymer transport system component